MSKPRWSVDQKKHHVTAWRTSGLTRQQYCELYDIPFKSLRQWPQDIAKAERRANEQIPALDRHWPFFLCIKQPKIQEFQQTGFIRECTFCFCQIPELTMD